VTFAVPPQTVTQQSQSIPILGYVFTHVST